MKYYKNLLHNYLALPPYIMEFNLLNTFSTFNGHPLRDAKKHKRLKPKMIPYIQEGLAADAKLCSDVGIQRSFPSKKDLKEHFISLTRVYADYKNILNSRKENNLKTGSKQVYPDYYNRNYHFQTDGYTSEHSAKLYDHQVEILFAGMAAPMRRTILEVLKKNKPLTLLEQACGCGSATEIVSKFLPDSHITATDLSHEYIDFAKKNKPFKNVEYLQADASKGTKKYDCIYNVFLMHELPSKVRETVVKKQIQNIKKGGVGIILESLQVGDIPFLDEVLYDFPKYYHEPFYKHYIEHSIEEQLKSLGAKNIKTQTRLFSKVVSFTN